MEVNKILCGDALEVIKTLPDESVNCVVTSPPYYGLRNYGVDGQIGLEPTVNDYILRLIDVFREVHRVLTPSATLWLNLGDSYASGKGTCVNPGGGCSSMGKEKKEAGAHPLYRGNVSDLRRQGLKPKDLIGVPWRVALALQEDGWWLRSDIVWNKPNPMPSSVTDRPTTSHEYIFLLTKSSRYYYDAEAIKEDSITCDPRRPYGSLGMWEIDGRATEQRGNGKVRSPAGWKTGSGSHGSIHADGRELEVTYVDNTFTKRNCRTVWTIPTYPLPEAHFATFPPELAERCIKAGCPEGGVILDPFMGAGTVGMVAKKLCRNYVGIELNPEYVTMAERRIDKECGGLF